MEKVAGGAVVERHFCRDDVDFRFDHLATQKIAFLEGHFKGLDVEIEPLIGSDPSSKKMVYVVTQPRGKTMEDLLDALIWEASKYICIKEGVR